MKGDQVSPKWIRSIHPKEGKIDAGDEITITITAQITHNVALALNHESISNLNANLHCYFQPAFRDRSQGNFQVYYT